MKLVPTFKGENPKIGAVIFDTETDEMKIFDGVKWRDIPKTDKPCAICKTTFMAHDIENHPYFENNLEYLAWRHETKNAE